MAQNPMGNHMVGNAGSPPSDPSFNGGGPGGPGPQFNGNTGGGGAGAGQNNRMGGGQKQPGMLPPPSPSLSKDQSGPNKDNKPDGSPRNPPSSGQTPTATGTAPPTPVPNNANPPNPTQNMAPSPSPMMSSSAPTSTSLASDMGLFSHDFINSVASSLDDFDPSMFRPDGDINFERDFGQWFSPDDVGAA